MNEQALLTSASTTSSQECCSARIEGAHRGLRELKGRREPVGGGLLPVTPHTSGLIRCYDITLCRGRSGRLSGVIFQTTRTRAHLSHTMGNLLFSTGLLRTDATKSDQVSRGCVTAKMICSGVTYYHTPFTLAGSETECAAKDFQTSAAPCPISPSAGASSSTLLSDSPSHTPVSSQNQSHSASTSRPLLLFFSWLGAQPGGVAKYRDLYLDRGMDVLLVQSSVMHFLWPRWGLKYGLKVLQILEEPQFADRVVLVHASSIGGYTFTQILTHIAQEPKKHAGLTQRMIGHVYDSLVVGTLEHMAIGIGKTLVPRLECFIKNTAMFYFWLFKTHTADFYETSIQVFHNSPVTAPALFFFSENDAMCNTAVLEKLIDFWRKRGVAVHSRKWKKSIHAAHLRCHPDDYLSTLQHFLHSLPVSSCKKTM